MLKISEIYCKKFFSENEKAGLILKSAKIGFSLSFLELGTGTVVRAINLQEEEKRQVFKRKKPAKKESKI